MKRQTIPAASKIHYGWIVAVGGFFTQTILLMGTSILPITLLMVEKALEISHADIGVIISANGVLFLVGAITWGIVADRIGLRKSLSLSSLITAIGIMCMGAITSIITGMVTYALVGFGSAALLALIPKLTGVWFEKSKRGLASSIIASGGAGSSSIFGIVVPILATGYGWRFPFYILGAIGLLLSVIIYTLIRDSPKEKGLFPVGAAPSKAAENSKETDQEEGVSTRHVLKMKATWHIGILYVFWQIGYLCTGTYLVAYLTETGLESVAAGSAYSLFWLFFLLGIILCGILSDYIPRKYVISIMGILQAVFISIFLNLAKGLITNYVMVSLIGISFGVVPVIWAIIADYFDSRFVGIAAGIIVCIGGLANIVGPLLAGTVAVMTGTLATALQISVISAIVTVILTLALKNPSISS